MPNGISQTLFDLADWRLRSEQEKQAFVPAGGGPPPGGDPAAAGGPPPGGDPAAAMGGGAPMDPAMAAGGGAPPMDPMAGGGGAAAPLDPAVIQQIVQTVMQQMGTGAGGAGGQPGPAGPGKGSAKVDPGLIYMELGRVRKLLTTMFQNLSWELPPDILDDSAVAQSVAGVNPAGAPLPAGGAPAAAPADPAAAAGPPGLPAVGQSGAINPIEPVGQEAGAGTAKAAADMRNKAADDVLSVLGLAARTGREMTPEAFGEANDRINDIAALSRSLNQGVAT